MDGRNQQARFEFRRPVQPEPRWRLAAWFWVCVGVCACGGPTGRCLAQTKPVSRAYQPDNVYRTTAMLPKDVQRVAVLPLASTGTSQELTEACEALDPILQVELIKTKRLEVVRITPEVLRRRTGRAAWTGEETLPAKFFEALREVSGCDAVLFGQITTFQAYAPLAVGWRLRLVDARSQHTLWAVDEVFDASQAAVANGARRFERPARTSARSPDDGWAVLNSPRHFGRYSAATLLATLPGR